MNIDNEISQRIAILRFPLIIGVIFIHSSGSIINFSTGNIGLETVPFLSSLIQNFISNGLARIAVPMFFLISGFLFFQNFDLRPDVIKKKLHRRVITLFIPYLLWNTFALVMYFILQSIPAMNEYFSGSTKLIIHYEFYDYLNAFLGLRITANSPIAYPFWFIRDLMIVVLLSPFIWRIAKHFPYTGFFSILTLWFINPQIPFFNLSYLGLFFFYSGAILSLKNPSITRIDLYGKKILIIYLLLTALDAYFMTIQNQQGWGEFQSRIIIFPGILSAWYIAGILNQHGIPKRILIKLSSSAFFVFAAHEPFLLAGLRKLMYKLIIPSGFLQITGIYFIAPLMTIIIALLVNMLLKKSMPALHKLINGLR